MSETIEARGRTVEEAIAEALLQMGARRDEVDVTVLDEGKGGLLGLFGARPARVRVTRRAGAARGGARREGRDGRARHADGRREGERREERRPRGEREEKPARGGRDRRGEGEARGERPPRPARDEIRPLGRPAPEAQPGTEADEDAQRARRRRRGGRGRRKRGEEAADAASPGAQPREYTPRAVQDAAAADQPPPAPAPAAGEPAPAPDAATVAGPAAPGEFATPSVAGLSLAAPVRATGPDEEPAVIERVATEIMVRSGFPCRCEVRPGDYHQVRITTDETSAAVLIGRHGATIDAIEHLVERMASLAVGAQVHMNLDINNYRRRREEKLVHRARQTAERVRATGQSESFEPLCARERRVVHLEVAKVAGLQTFTVAEELGKRVVVAPEGATPPPEAAAGAEADIGGDARHDDASCHDDAFPKPDDRDGSDRPEAPGRDDA